MPAASKVALQQVPCTSIALSAPPHTPHASNVPPGQHRPALSSELLSSQHVLLLSRRPDGQQRCFASTIPLLQLAATCTKESRRLHCNHLVPAMPICMNTASADYLLIAKGWHAGLWTDHTGSFALQRSVIKLHLNTQMSVTDYYLV